MDLTELIKTRLQEAFQPRALSVIDESHLHHGHVAHTAGGRHFAIQLDSLHFVNMTRIAAHRAVYELFTDLMPYPLHALKIKIKSC